MLHFIVRQTQGQNGRDDWLKAWVCLRAFVDCSRSTARFRIDARNTQSSKSHESKRASSIRGSTEVTTDLRGFTSRDATWNDSSTQMPHPLHHFAMVPSVKLARVKIGISR